MSDMLRGCGTALVTPFTSSGTVDEAAFRALVDWQIEEGIHFLVPCGSTGEAATLTDEEHLRVVRLAAEQAAGRVPVVGGVNGNDTRATVEQAKAVADQGPSHVMVVGPPYNRPPQRGFVAHFTAVADAVDVPVVVYNVPGRTGSNILSRTTLQLAQHPNICGVKEASGNMDQILDVILHRPQGFSVLSGDDPLTVPFMALGGDGDGPGRPARGSPADEDASTDHDRGIRGEQSDANEGRHGGARAYGERRPFAARPARRGAPAQAP
jgi:4-hydroxy-tetrahydrodipicolinate synthase